MKFENFIKKLSAAAASIVVFLLAAGMYLSFKGFVLNEDGSITLVKKANAAEQPIGDIDSIGKKLPQNLIIPYGKVLGTEKAPVALYEYSSFGCFHCANFHLNILPKIKKEFVDTGKVKVIFIDFPLEQKSLQASLASHCFRGKKYFDYLKILFEKQHEWGTSSQTVPLLKKYAEQLGVSGEEIENCLNDKKQLQEIMDNRQYAIKHLEISGTPSFVVSSLKDRRIIYGAPNFETMKAVLEKNIPAK